MSEEEDRGQFFALEDINQVSRPKKKKVQQFYPRRHVCKRKLGPIFDAVAADMANNSTLALQNKARSRRMQAVSMEQTALLGPGRGQRKRSITTAVSMEENAPHSMDDVELRSVPLQLPVTLRISDSTASSDARVRTEHGNLVVAVRGDRAKPAIITYHDLGVNYSSFLPFFGYVDMRALMENFCVYHVNAPGQEDGAPTLPEEYVYPTIEDMANQLNNVMDHFGLKTFIGLGVGAGANVLAKFAINHPTKVDALALINCSSTSAGWMEWAYQKMYTRTLRSRGVTQGVLDYLMWHHFGRWSEERNPDLAEMYRGHFTRNVNPSNLAHYIDAYVRRTDLNISRTAHTIRVPVLNITGALSPYVEETVTFNGRLNPNISTWMKISDCGLVLDEQPGKFAEAFRLFLQGEGCAVLKLHKIGSNMCARCHSFDGSVASTSSV